MKTYLLALSLLLTLTTTTLAQERTYGLTFDDLEFGAIPTFPDPNQGAKSIGALPLNADLSRFALPPIDQGKLTTCVAISTLYVAYPTQYAIQNNITDPAEIQRRALSFMLPYKKLRPNCIGGLNLDAIAQHVIDNGDVTHQEYTRCEDEPSKALEEKARQNRPIKQVVKIFGKTNTNREKVFFTQQQIGLYNTPVIVGIQATDRFRKLTASDDYYQPGGNFEGLHAVTVVGYDRVSFKILNSWGPNWGRNGYFSIRFDDFAQIALGGIVLVLPDSPTPGKGSNTTEVGGNFAFQYLDNNTGNFNQVSPKHMGNGVYELSRKDWQIGDRFQLLASNARQAQYVCVFSINPKNEIKAHYPLNQKLAAVQDNSYGMNVTDILPKAKFDLVIPAEDKALVIEESGTDYLCVIYSDKPLLDELPAILQRIRNSSGDIYSRLRAGLGSRLVPSQFINYQNNQMGATTSTTQGDVIPLVLKVQSVN
ncbi:C1 family peptidase [Spirosoma litoris]